MLVPASTASDTRTIAAADEALLLDALAEAGDAMTAALVAHDLDAITAATHDAETLVEQLERVERGARAKRADRERRAAVAERIGASARRNAVLLESAWATDAALLRLLAAAALEADAAAAGYEPAPAGPAGWLDRSA
jgi:hypothetical protein